MRAQSDASPIGRLPSVREGASAFFKCRNEFMHQVRMRTAMARSLREAEMRFLRQIVNASGSKTPNGPGQEFRKIGHFDFPGNLCFRELGGVEHMRFMLDESPFERSFGAVNINTLPVLPGCIKERAINAGAKVRVLELDMGRFNCKRRTIALDQ